MAEHGIYKIIPYRDNQYILICPIHKMDFTYEGYKNIYASGFFELVGLFVLPPNFFYVDIHSTFLNIENLKLQLYSITNWPAAVHYTYKFSFPIDISKSEVFQLPTLSTTFKISAQLKYNFQTLEKAGFGLFESDVAKFIDQIEEQSTSNKVESNSLKYKNVYNIDEIANTPSNAIMKPIPYIKNKNSIINNYISCLYTYNHLVNASIDLANVKFNIKLSYSFKQKKINLNINSNTIKNKSIISTRFDFSKDDLILDEQFIYQGFLFPYKGDVKIDLWFFINNIYYYDSIKQTIQSDIFGPNSIANKSDFKSIDGAVNLYGV